MSLSNKVLVGSAWLTGTKIFIGIFRVAVLAILARILTPNDFGISQGVMVVLMFIVSIPNVGFGGAVIQRKDLNQDHIDAAFWSYIGIGILTAALLYFGAASFAAFFQAPEIKGIFQTIFFLPVIISFGALSNNLLFKNLKIKQASLNDVGAYLFGYIPITLGLAFWGFGYWALVLGFTAQRVLEIILNIIAHPHPVRFRFCGKAFGELLSFSLHNSMSRIFGMAANQADSIITGRFLGPAALGIYSRAYSLMTANVNLVSEVIDRILFSAFSIRQDEPGKILDAYYKIEFFINLVFLPLSLFCFFSSAEIVYVFLGGNWTEAAIIFRVLSIGLVFRVNFKVINQILKATGAITKVTRITLSNLLVSASAMLALKGYGLVGIAAGFTLGLIFQYAQLLYYLKKQIPAFELRELGRKNLPILASAAAAVFLLTVANWLNINQLAWFYTLLLNGIVIVLCFLPLLRTKEVRRVLPKLFNLIQKPT